MAALEIRDLSVSYQSSTGIVEALSNVNLAMGSGDFRLPSAHPVAARPRSCP